MVTLPVGSRRIWRLTLSKPAKAPRSAVLTGLVTRS